MRDRFVAHWRILWTPWGSLFVGRHNGRLSLFSGKAGSAGGGFFIDVWVGPRDDA
jgi:hypothetical protein